MARSKDNPLSALRRKIFRLSRSSSNTVFIVHTNDGSFIHDEFHSSTKEELAAITIQACSRGHLARRAYRALRSLVKLQALVRGAGVRKQARLALNCMHALARLHVSVRTRQILRIDN